MIEEAMRQSRLEFEHFERDKLVREPSGPRPSTTDHTICRSGFRVQGAGSTQVSANGGNGSWPLGSMRLRLFRGSSRFESLILSHHSRRKVACECNE